MKGLIIGLAVLAILGGAFYGGISLWQKGQPQATVAPQGSPLATTTVNGTTVKLYGDLRNGLSELQVQLLDKDNNPLEAGQVKLELTMDMPGMEMNEGVPLLLLGPQAFTRLKLNPPWLVIGMPRFHGMVQKGRNKRSSQSQ